MSIEKGWEAIRRMQAVSDEEVASMATDTKAVARYRTTLSHGLIETEEHPIGPLVFFTDHERVVGDEVEHRRRWFVRAGEYLSRAQAAELSASRSAEECLFLRSQRPLARKLTEAEAEIETLRTALAASRAEVEGLKKDAERWRHARRILSVLYIEDSQEKHVMWARSADEAENVKADKAIDAAMEKGNV